jgi:hypothetical protein
MGRLYLLECKGLYKIGITTQHPKKRIKNLQTGNPHTISLVYYKTCSNYLAMEKYFHKKFSDKRLVGEWFSLDAEDIGHIITCKKYSVFKAKKEK